MFRKFQEEYEKDNGRFDDSKREKLLDNFQKVYRIISLINNPKKMLEEEFDGEANIANLSRMGESTELKRELKSLIKIYLDTLIGGEQPKKLLLAIDDLDLCNANAYKMAEQMRKYLIIPDVVIVMALKVEQLQMCIQEENFKNYSNLLHGDYKSSEFYEEVRNMAEKYITKLIPRSRRIYLPNVQYMLNTQICYLDNEQNIIYQDQISNSLNVSLVSLTFKTAKSLLVKSLSTIAHTHFLIFAKYLCPSFKAIKHSFFFNVLVSMLKPKISLFKYLELLIDALSKSAKKPTVI